MSSYYDDASLMLLASGGAQKDGKVYSVKPTDGSGDFTFTRGSNLSATRVDASQLIEKGRENLLTYSNDFSNAAWSRVATSLTSGQSGYDGSSDAWLYQATGGATGVYFFQSQTITQIRTRSIYAKAGTQSTITFLWDSFNNNKFATFDLSSGTFTNAGCIASIESVGGGWYRCSTTITNASNGYAFLISLSNETGNGLPSGSSIYIQDAQQELGLVATPYIETGASTAQAGILENTPRFDYSGGATCPSLLLEPSRTNLTPQSEYFGSGYTFTNVTTAANAAISPEGVSNAYEMTDDATNGNHRFIRQITGNTIGQSYTYSIFLKKGTMTNAFLNLFSGGTIANVSVDLENGTISGGGGTSQTIEDYGNDWYRCSVTGVAGDSSVYIYLYMNQLGGYVGVGSNLYFYGAQLEQGSYLTSYIPTYGVSQTRAQDNCVKSGIQNLLGQTEGVIFFDGVCDNLEQDATLLCTNRQTSFAVLLTKTANQEIIGRVWNDNFVRISFISSALPSGRFKAALKYKSGSTALFVNGVKIGENATTFTPTANINQLCLTSYGSPYFSYKESVYANEALVFTTALSDLDLAILTGATTYNTFAAMALALNYTVYE